MVAQGLTDIDSLCLAVRDRESRRLILEAVTAYRGGAFRSAIMSTWIAVAYDIIAKARELAAQGEAAPRTFVANLDAAISHKNVPSMQRIESDLLKTANEDLQLLAPHEYAALKRMQEDRNLCAHPAFVVEDELYQPTPELVRTHVVHALQHLLISAPLQGKGAIARFEADMLSPSYPVRSEDIRGFIRGKYLDQAKDVLVKNLIKGLLTAPFGAERTKFAGKERVIATTLKEISAAKTAVYDDIVPVFAQRRFDSVGDDVLLKICVFLDADSRLWEWLSEPARLRIRRLLETSDIALLKSTSAFDAFAVPQLAAVLIDRFNASDLDTQIGVIADNPRREFVGRAIELYGASGGWRTAEFRGQSLMVRLAPLFTADNIQSMLDVVSGNTQVSEAAGTPAVLESVFDLSKPILNESRQHWREFVDRMTAAQRGNVQAPYAYPGIRARLDAA